MRNRQLQVSKEEDKEADAEAAQQWWRKWLRERIDVNISVSLDQDELEPRRNASSASRNRSFWRLDTNDDAKSISSGYSEQLTLLGRAEKGADPP